MLLNSGFKDVWDSNVGRRYLSWLWIAPFYLATVFLGGTTSLVFLLLVMLVATWEYQRVSNLPRPYAWALYLLSILSVYVTSYETTWFYSLPLIYFTTLTGVGIHSDDDEAFGHVAGTLFFSIWVLFSLCHFIRLGHLNNALDFTKSLLILIGFAVPLSDIGAYLVGNWMYKKNVFTTRIAERISPNKTYGGILGNILGAGAGIALLWFTLQAYFPVWVWVVLACIIGFNAVLGDLTESMVKRHYDVKDSSSLIPGHGGVLDRIDSSVRVILAVFYLLQLLL